MNIVASKIECSVERLHHLSSDTSCYSDNTQTPTNSPNFPHTRTLFHFLPLRFFFLFVTVVIPRFFPFLFSLDSPNPPLLSAAPSSRRSHTLGRHRCSPDNIDSLQFDDIRWLPSPSWNNGFAPPPTHTHTHAHTFNSCGPWQTQLCDAVLTSSSTSSSSTSSYSSSSPPSPPFVPSVTAVLLFIFFFLAFIYLRSCHETTSDGHLRKANLQYRKNIESQFSSGDNDRCGWCWLAWCFWFVFF